MTITHTRASVSQMLATEVASINQLDDFVGSVQFGFEITDEVGEVVVVEDDSTDPVGITEALASGDLTFLDELSEQFGASGPGSVSHLKFRVNPLWLDELDEAYARSLLRGEAIHWLNTQVNEAERSFQTAMRP
jgi:hypothetical protein